MKCAVLFIVFNRPDTTGQVFEAIRAAKPPRLYVAADGFRADKEDEQLRCALVRQIATNVDWPCELLTLFRDTNLGCKMGVSGAIDWFFSHEEEGIILEDDVLPLPSFFSFCDELLDRYRYSENVTMISGCNLISKRYHPSESYFFSRYCHIWGWATWRRAWKNYDVSMMSWPNWYAKGGLSSIVNNEPQIEEYWKKTFEAVYSGRIDTWDYQWVFSCWKQGGLSVLPKNNLIHNIGFGVDATHTKMDIPSCVLESVPQDLDFPLVHPKQVRRGHESDEIFDRHIFGYNKQANSPTNETGVLMIEQSIDSMHRNKTGKVSDKWESYLGYYDLLFASLRDCPISMLEIGVQNGGSLDTWSEYFRSGQRFVGCDIDPKCGSLKYDDSRISIVIGDANTAKTYKSIHAISPNFDIIIDDGSHVSMDILNSFVNYFPLVKPGGLYVVEDTHTLYADQFGGGILNEFGAYSFFKKLIDVISFQFWRDQVSINTYFRTFFPLKSTPNFILEGWVDSIEFRNSIITIRKAFTAGHEKLGNRIVVGNSAQVQTWQGTFVPEVPAPTSNTQPKD